ncbi:outer membrane beta-barrel protein [Neolewinella persica]|uniref:outer membrane beta-barrel protein n=1 Tax=Neolewinella persica TaxID=70998 RepID=UPI00036BFD51|nr:outer membrane beta-barrel protein [Neolewinella persica]
MQRITILFFVLFSCTLHAQYEQGNWYLSGNSVLDAGNQTTVAGSSFLPESASRSGYFLFDRLLVGGNVLNPAAFVRYYQPLKSQGKLSAFAELNVAAVLGRRGTTTFQPAIGLEYQLAPEVLLSATLQYSVEVDPANSLSLQFGVNTFIGRGGLAPGQNLLRKGALFIDPNIGSITFGNRSFGNGNINWLGVDLHFGGGLMLTDRISLDGSISASNYNSESDFSNSATLFTATEVAADIGLRYFVTGKGKFRPYISGGLSSRYFFRVAKYETPGRPDDTSNDFDFNPYLKLGTLFFLSDKVALDAGVEYNFRDNNNDGAFNSKMGLGVGLKIFLGGGKKP